MQAMARRRTSFSVGEYYHLYNRGVDKRDIVLDQADSIRFLQSMKLFNSVQPIGSIYEHGYVKLGSEASKLKPLVSFAAYCLNPNHFHFLVTPRVDQGIERFMQRFGTGYTKYFNNKRSRTGALFGGVFKSEYISNDDYLRQVSAYINYNDFIHGLPKSKQPLVRTSLKLYQGSSADAILPLINFEHGIILGEFKDGEEYCKYAKEIAENIREYRSEEDTEAFLGSEASKLGD